MTEEGFFEGKGVRSARAESAIKALGKIKDKSWKAMDGAFTAMAEFSKAGGMAGFMGGTMSAIKTRIETSITGMFAPVINEITQLGSDVAVEFIPILENIAAGIGTLIGTLKGIELGPGTDQSLWDGIMAALTGIIGLTGWIFTEWLPALLGWGSKTEEFLAGGGADAIIGIIGGGTGPGYNRPSGGGDFEFHDF